MPAQAVNRRIAELHPEATAQNIYTLLIDGCNILKISMKDEKVGLDGRHVGGIFQFLLQLKIMLKKKDFDYVYVMWDGDNSGQLRYNVYPLYKANRDKNYYKSDYERGINEYVKKIIQKSKERFKDEEYRRKVENEEEEFEREKVEIQKLLEELFIRQVSVNEIEGDDLMAYYVLNKKQNEKVVIMSNDKDLSQLLSEDVCIFLSRDKQFLTYDNHKEIVGYHPDNVLLKKVICGDSSDNIKGVKGVGETTLFKIFPEIRERKVELYEVRQRCMENMEERILQGKKPILAQQNIIRGVSEGLEDGEVYKVNEKIIDLKHPMMTDEAVESMKESCYIPIDPSGRDYQNVYKIVSENQISDLLDTGNFASFFSDFERIAWKEKKRFEEAFKQR